MPQVSPKHAFCHKLNRLLVSMAAVSLLASSAMATEMLGWSDKTVCRLLTAKPDNAEFAAEAQQRGLNCGSGAESSGKKQQAGENSIPKNQGIVLYALNLPPKLKEQLLSLAINKTDFDFSPYQLAILEQPIVCEFNLRRVQYDDDPEGLIEHWSMARGRLIITTEDVKIQGAWRMGGLSNDRSYFKNEVNLKLTKAGHLVGKMAFFLLNVKPGQVLKKPLYVELKPHKRSKPLDLTTLNNAELWNDAEDWAGGVWTLTQCKRSSS